MIKHENMFTKTPLQETVVIKTLHSFIESDLNGEKINQVMGNLNDILLTAAKKSCFIKKFKILNNQKKYKSHNWYNKECKGKRDILRQLSKSMSQSPFDKSKRQKFVSARSAYKKACREAEKAFRRKLTDTLKEIGQNDPKTFWDIISKMNN